MTDSEPILEYAQGRGDYKRAATHWVAKLLIGACSGGLTGLLSSHLLATELGPIAYGRIPGLMLLGLVIGCVIQSCFLPAKNVALCRWAAGIGVALLVAFYLWTIAASNTRLRAEMGHGIRFPRSARNWQCRGDALTGVLDRVALTSVEINGTDLPAFVSQLKVNPAIADHVYASSNPIPGTARFKQLLKCNSPVGDFLVVEIWDVPGGNHLIRLYTDWN